MRHIPVLVDEVIEALALSPGRHVVDCTLGDGGHAEKILEAIAPNGKLLGIDADAESLLRAKQFLYGFSDRVVFSRGNFSALHEIVNREAFGPVHGILLDLGWSSPQFEERGRGFSFQKPDEPLDMRYEKNGKETLTAAGILREASEEELEEILRVYGEERLSREIAHAIAEKRSDAPLERVYELVELILAVYRKKLNTNKEIPWVGGVHPATKTFQALRIAVNHELESLRRVLPQAIEMLANGGRLAVITFHSLEDRIVKHFFKSEEGVRLKQVHKKAIQCSAEEYEQNPRARSAKLRVAEKI